MDEKIGNEGKFNFTFHIRSRSQTLQYASTVHVIQINVHYPISIPRIDLIYLTYVLPISASKSLKESMKVQARRSYNFCGLTF